MKIQLKSLKVANHLSEETLAFSATLYVNGKSIGRVKNSGHGGCNEYDNWPTKEMRDAASEWCKAHEGHDGYGEPFGCVLDHIIAEQMTAKQVRGWCRTKTVFTTPDSKEGEYRTYKGKPDTKVSEGGVVMSLRELIASRHEGATIVNDNLPPTSVVVDLEPAEVS